LAVTAAAGAGQQLVALFIVNNNRYHYIQPTSQKKASR